MEFKGTKGKWVVEKTHEKGKWIQSEDGGYCAISAGSTLEESKANALLISKAPEMLEMLKDIKDYLGSDKRTEVELLIKEATQIK